MKRIVSVLLVVCVLTSMISVGIVTSSASTISSSDDYYTYKESYIKNYCTYDYLVNEMRLPYRAFVETLDKDTAFQVELDAWKLATISPDSLVTEITQSQQCKYYEAILIDLLVRNTQEESFIENVQSFKDSIHVSAWKKYVDYNSNILIDTPITSENADAILKEIKSMGNFGKALEYADTISDYIDYAVDISDLFDKLSKLEMIAQMSESYAEVLNIMSSKCGNNVYLNTAIDNVALVFSKDLTVEQIKSIFIAKSAPYVVFEEFMKEVKKQVISYLGMAGLAIDLAQSVGTVVANSWFGTEDMINDYYEMSSLYEIEDLLRTAVLNTNGSTFCAAFKMYENICLMGCDYSKKYVEPLYTSLFGKLFAWATNQNYENYSAQLDDLKEQLSFMFEMIDVGADSWYVIDTGNTENMNVVNGNYTITQYTKDDYKNQNEDIVVDVYSTYGGSNNGNDLTLNKDLAIYNDFDITGGNIDLNGHKIIVNGDLTQSNGTIDINKGNLTITGNYYQNAGTMNINGGRLNVSKDYIMSNVEYISGWYANYYNSLLKMANPDDVVIINGNFLTESYSSHGGLLTDGIMYIKGDFTQKGNSNYDNPTNNSYSNFRATDNHKVVLCGKNTQKISFEGDNSQFADVEFLNKNIEFSGKISGWKLQRDTTFDCDINLPLSGTLDLNGYNFKINGNLLLKSGTININNGNLIIDGDLTQSNGTIDINKGNLTITGNYYQNAGTMNINGGRLNVSKDYIMSNVEYISGWYANYYNSLLKMANPDDVVIINGNFLTESYSSHGGLLTDGIMYIKGDFTQKGNSNYDNPTNNSYSNFRATDNHKVVLCGENTQKISFEGSSSYFNILELTKDRETGYVFNRDNCWNELIITKKSIIGDVNGDGVISIADATTLQKYLANIVDFDDEQLAVADTNGDGSVSIADATQIQKYLAQLIPSLG